jgi:uncharacterized protein YbaP (TraB family)
VRREFIAGLLAGLTASSALAAPPVDPEGVVVQELVVTAKVRGPAWWQVSSSTSTIYILGSPGALPKGLRWDTATARRHLAGANMLIVPPRVTAGLGDIFALLSIRRHFRSRTPMEDSLQPTLRARFLAARPSLNPDPHAYSNWTPLAAGLLMVADARKQARLDRAEPEETINGLARSQGVKIVPAGTYKAVPVLRAAESGLDTSGPACMADALDEIEAGPGRAKAAAEGWARGDVGAAISAERGYEKCVNSLPEGADVITRSMADSAATIARALTKPGHSVAVVNLRTLLAQNGVLQRLKAQGFKIVTPDQ